MVQDPRGEELVRPGMGYYKSNAKAASQDNPRKSSIPLRKVRQTTDLAAFKEPDGEIVAKMCLFMPRIRNHVTLSNNNVLSSRPCYPAMTAQTIPLPGAIGDTHPKLLNWPIWHGMFHQNQKFATVSTQMLIRGITDFDHHP